jgi:hypothetical protein
VKEKFTALLETGSKFIFLRLCQFLFDVKKAALHWIGVRYLQLKQGGTEKL